MTRYNRVELIESRVENLVLSVECKSQFDGWFVCKIFCWVSIR